MLNQLKLTLIICVADDARIKTTLKSIDECCEVIVVLNGATKEVKLIVNEFKPIMKQNFISGVYYTIWNIIYCIGYFICKPI